MACSTLIPLSPITFALFLAGAASFFLINRLRWAHRLRSQTSASRDSAGGQIHLQDGIRPGRPAAHIHTHPVCGWLHSSIDHACPPGSAAVGNAGSHVFAVLVTCQSSAPFRQAFLSSPDHAAMHAPAWTPSDETAFVSAGWSPLHETTQRCICWFGGHSPRKSLMLAGCTSPPNTTQRCIHWAGGQRAEEVFLSAGIFPLYETTQRCILWVGNLLIEEALVLAACHPFTRPRSDAFAGCLVLCHKIIVHWRATRVFTTPRSDAFSGGLVRRLHQEAGAPDQCYDQGAGGSWRGRDKDFVPVKGAQAPTAGLTC